jgi:hypothetical protein
MLEEFLVVQTSIRQLEDMSSKLRSGDLTPRETIEQIEDIADALRETRNFLAKEANKCEVCEEYKLMCQCHDIEEEN